MSLEIQANLVYVLGIAQGLLIGWALWRRPSLSYTASEDQP